MSIVPSATEAGWLALLPPLSCFLAVQWLHPGHVVRVLLANVHAGAMRAIGYAQSLGVEDVRAVSFAFDEAEADRFRGQWQRAGMTIPRCESMML